MRQVPRRIDGIGPRIVPDVLPNPAVVTMLESDSVAEASRQMAAGETDAVIVTRPDGALAGVVTAGDVCRQVVAQGLDAERTPLSRAMTRKTDTLEPKDLAFDAFELMQVRGYSHLPVVEGDRPIGLISIRDLLRAMKPVVDRHIADARNRLFELPPDTSGPS
jgi:CBS domain-containing protein